MWAGSNHSWPVSVPGCQRWAHGGLGDSVTQPWSTLSPMLIALTLVLLTSGCAALTSSEIPPRPPRPTLESLTPTAEGGICMDRQDAAELLLYIDQLERR